MKKLFFFVMIAASLSACNTFEGLGKDIQKGGELIQKNSK